MTRINLIDVEKLTDQHLLSEYRELPRVFWLVKIRIQKWKNIIVSQQTYTLWKWHVIFFFDKLLFLKKRLTKIINECKKRWFNISFQNEIDLSKFPDELTKDYFPNIDEIEISRKRIQEKIESHKWFYRYYWRLIN